MTNAAIPSVNVSLVDAGGNITMPWQRYLLSLHNSVAAISASPTAAPVPESMASGSEIASGVDIAIQGLVVRSDVEFLNFVGPAVSGQGSPPPFGATVTIASVTTWEDDGTTIAVPVTTLGGDLSLHYGDPPSIVQGAVANSVGNGSTITLPNPVTVGNFLLCFIGNFDSPGALPNGFTAIDTGGGTTGSYLIATSTASTFTLEGFGSQGGNCAVLYELANVMSIGAASSWSWEPGGVAQVLTAPAFGNTNAAQSIYFGFFTNDAASVSPLPDFSAPGPFPAYISESAIGNGYSDIVAGAVVLGNGNGPVAFSIFPEVPSDHFADFVGVQLVGNPSNNSTTLVGTPVLTVDGFTILPTQISDGIAGPAITTAGMLEFIIPGTLGAYLTIESAGTVENAAVSSLDFIGGGVAVSGSGATETISIPGVEFSGTQVEDLTAGVGLAGTVADGTLVLSNGGVLAIIQSGTTSTGTVTVDGGMGSGLIFEDSFGHTIASPGTLEFLNGTLGGNATVATYTAPSGGGGGGIPVSISFLESGTLTITNQVTVVYSLGGATITLPAPATCDGAVIILFANAGGCTLYTPAGAFYGPGGSGTNSEAVASISKTYLVSSQGAWLI